MKTIDAILRTLCLYDKRNPDCVNTVCDDFPEECSCDNCFYGKTSLAKDILQLRNMLETMAKTFREWHDPVACETGPNCAACKVLTRYKPEWKSPPIDETNPIG